VAKNPIGIGQAWNPFGSRRRVRAGWVDSEPISSLVFGAYQQGINQAEPSALDATESIT
jgi:hypothetical protein